MLHIGRHFWVCNLWNRFRLHSLYPQCFVLLVFFFLFYQIKNFLYLLWVNLYIITGIYLHEPPFLTAHFSWPLLFLSLKKLWPSLCFHPLSTADFWQVHGLVPNTFGNAGMGIARHISNMVMILGTTIRNLAPIGQSGPKHSQNRPLALIGHVINAFFN